MIYIELMYGIFKNCIVILFLFLGLNTSTYSQDDHSKPILYVFLSDECIITQYYVPSLNDIWVQFGKEVDMVAIFPNFSSKAKKIQSFYDKYKLKIPHKTDYYKVLSKSLGATITPEAILLDASGRTVYKGRIDNSYVEIGKRRRVVTAHELSDALKSLTNDREIAIPQTEAVGCFINFNDKISNNK